MVFQFGVYFGHILGFRGDTIHILCWDADWCDYYVAIVYPEFSKLVCPD